MPTRKSPRKGSLQFWPRKRANKFLPSVNWNAISTSSVKNIKGFMGYKAGMVSAYVKDNTPNSVTKGKNIIIPLTILECPRMKIYSVRFHKNKKVVKEILANNLDKELKKKVKLPKNQKKSEIKDFKIDEEYDDISIIAYSIVKETSIKKVPDINEIGLEGDLEKKLNFVKEKIDKEISIEEVFEKGQLIDVRGLTKGKGLSGPVKRFGIRLKNSKSEKGRRRPGNLGPWHPARVTFRVPQAGQLGMFTRIVYNNKIIGLQKRDEKIKGLKHFGDVKSDYILVRGSIQGPQKRQLLITSPMRENKKQLKKDFEIISLR